MPPVLLEISEELECEGLCAAVSFLLACPERAREVVPCALPVASDPAQIAESRLDGDDVSGGPEARVDLPRPLQFLLGLGPSCGPVKRHTEVVQAARDGGGPAQPLVDIKSALEVLDGGREVARTLGQNAEVVVCPCNSLVVPEAPVADKAVHEAVPGSRHVAEFRMRGAQCLAGLRQQGAVRFLPEHRVRLLGLAQRSPEAAALRFRSGQNDVGLRRHHTVPRAAGER